MVAVSGEAKHTLLLSQISYKLAEAETHGFFSIPFFSIPLHRIAAVSGEVAAGQEGIFKHTTLLQNLSHCSPLLTRKKLNDANKHHRISTN